MPVVSTTQKTQPYNVTCRRFGMLLVWGFAIFLAGCQLFEERVPYIPQRGVVEGYDPQRTTSPQRRAPSTLQQGVYPPNASRSLTRVAPRIQMVAPYPAQVNPGATFPANTVYPTGSPGALIYNVPSQPSTLGWSESSVAMLLPFSAGGEAAAVAEQMRRAALLARSESNSNVKIEFFDSKGTAQGAAEAASKALESGARLILGPLLAAEVDGAASVALVHDVPILAFSTDATRARPGVFLLGKDPLLSVRQVLQLAQRQGMKSFLAIGANDRLGRRMIEEARSTGVFLQNVITYDPNSKDDQQAKAESAMSGAQYDAVLIADTGERAKLTAALLAYYGLDVGRTRLLGASVWLGENLGKDALMKQAWIAAPENSKWRRFRETFEAKFDQTPHEAAAYAYDAVKIADHLTRLNRGFSREVILRSGPYDTTFGPTSLQSDGRAFRRVELVTLSSVSG